MLLTKDTRVIFSISTNPGNTGMIIHNSLFKRHNLNYVYKSMYVAPDRFNDAMIGMHALGIHGFSVSMPFKHIAAANCVIFADANSAKTRVVNTLLRYDNGFIGFNTDVSGAKDAIQENFGEYISSATIYGAGATAHSVALALFQLGCTRFNICNRDYSKLNSLLFFIQSLSDKNVCFIQKDLNFYNKNMIDIFVNCTSVGMNKQDEDILLSEESMLSYKCIFDVVPKQTNLTKRADSLGLKYIKGTSMAINQALYQFQIYTGYEGLDHCFEKQFIEKNIGLNI